MKKFSKERQKGARRNVQTRWQGLAKMLALVARCGHTENVAPVISSFEAVDLLATQKHI